jgi:hypothetical protein
MENDRTIAARSFELFQSLSEIQKAEIGVKLVASIAEAISQSVAATIAAGVVLARRVASVELLLKTELNEYFVRKFDNVTKAMAFLLELQEDVADARGRIEPKN